MRTIKQRRFGENLSEVPFFVPANQKPSGDAPERKKEHRVEESRSLAGT